MRRQSKNHNLLLMFRLSDTLQQTGTAVMTSLKMDTKPCPQARPRKLLSKNNAQTVLQTRNGKHTNKVIIREAHDKLPIHISQFHFNKTT